METIIKDLLVNNDAWKNENIYNALYKYSIENRQEYWKAQLDRLSWTKKPTIIFEDLSNGLTSWFSDGKINACYNCVDRHAEKNPNKTAIIWQSEDFNKSLNISYQKLKEEVCRFANVLKSLNLTRNDYITVYMPMVPEGIYACLACARLGIPYTAVFAGFSPNAVALRMNNCDSNFVITCDGNLRGGKLINLKSNIDEARKLCDRDIRCLVVKRQNMDNKWDNKLDFDYYDLVKNQSTDCDIADTDSNSELFILYTSGSVGQPKGVVMSTGGFLLFSMITGRYFFNLEENAVFWCSGDIGWMGGHSYSLYSALANGVTSVFFEGIPTYPRNSIFWEIIDKHHVTSFNTAPTAIRAMMKNSEETLKGTTRESLKYLGVFGEILNKEAWNWYFHQVGNGRCPIVNMWGQTELGGVPTAPLSNLSDMKTYGHIGRQFFGCELLLKDENDETIIHPEKTGALFLKHSLPGMFIKIFGDKTAAKRTYYSQSQDNIYFTGDEAYFDFEGNYWITGRVDDVLNVSGHRISPIEIEEVIAISNIVAEVSVVGYPHEIKGEGIYAFVVLKDGLTADEIFNAKKIISDIVRELISPITKPDHISIVKDLPKTRSGKIMRRVLRKIAANDTKDFEDLTTISNPECIENIIETCKE